MLMYFPNKRASDKIKMLQKCAGSELTRILIAGPEDEPLYMLKQDIQEWLKWINNRILFQLPKIKTNTDVQWVGVRIRIATSMLNKFEQNGTLDKNICLLYHKRLTSNVRKILGEIYCEDLPFLG